MRVRVPAASTLLVLLAVALAGCLSSPAAPTASTGDDLSDLPLERLLPHTDRSDDHDHANASQHEDAGWNLRVAGWTPHTDDLAELGAYNHVDVHGGYAFVSAYAVPPTMEPGLIVVDLSNMSTVARWTSDFVTPIDVHVSADGDYAAVAGHRLLGVDSPIPPTCTGAPTPLRPVTACTPFVPAGVQVLDVSDPAAPTEVARWSSAPSGIHTVKLAEVDGALHVFAASYGFSYVDRLVSSVEVLRMDASAPDGLSHVTRFFPSEPSGGRVFVHDMWVEPHPATGDTLMYVAYWDGGVVIADVDDPSDPVEIAQWDGFDRASYGNVHFARPMPTLLDGRHLTVLTPEFSSSPHSGETYFLDTTDPADPQLLGTWTVPGDPEIPGGYLYSPHNHDFTADGRMVMGHSHAGVWLFDLTPLVDGAAEPTVLGYRVPVPPAEARGAIDRAPSVWHGAFTDDGRIAVSDSQTGLYLMEIASMEPGEPPYVEALAAAEAGGA